MPSAVEECREPSGNFTWSGKWSPCLLQRQISMQNLLIST